MYEYISFGWLLSVLMLLMRWGVRLCARSVSSSMFFQLSSGMSSE